MLTYSLNAIICIARIDFRVPPPPPPPLPLGIAPSIFFPFFPFFLLSFSIHPAACKYARARTRRYDAACGNA